MAKHIPVPLDIDDPAIPEINERIHRKLTGDKALDFPDYCRDAGAAQSFLEQWTKEQYLLNPSNGNFICIRDTRMRIHMTVWTRWRVSLYYYDTEDRRSKWHTMKHTSYAFAVTCAVLQAYINGQYVQ